MDDAQRPAYAKNEAIEFHDSRLANIATEGERTLVRFLSAELHTSEGSPGIDPGENWLQPATLIVEGGSFCDPGIAWPADVYNGEITVTVADPNLGGWQGGSLLHLPFTTTDSFELRLTIMDDDDNWWDLVIAGAGGHLRLEGEPRHLQPFRGKE